MVRMSSDAHWWFVKTMAPMSLMMTVFVTIATLIMSIFSALDTFDQFCDASASRPTADRISRVLR
jgi:hypothetical protein